MHDFFDKLGAAAKRAASTVASEVNVAAEEQKVKECYLALGKLYYQAVKEGMEPAGAAAEYCDRIDASLRRIADLKDGRKVSYEPVTTPAAEAPEPPKEAPTAESGDFVDAE